MLGRVGQVIDQAFEPVYNLFYKYGPTIAGEKTDRIVSLYLVADAIGDGLMNGLFCGMVDDIQKSQHGVCLINRVNRGVGDWESVNVAVVIGAILVIRSTFSILNRAQNTIRMFREDEDPDFQLEVRESAEEVIARSIFKGHFSLCILTSCMSALTGGILYEVKRRIETQTYDSGLLISTLGLLVAVVGGVSLINIEGIKQITGGSLLLGVASAYNIQSTVIRYITELTSCLGVSQLEVKKIESKQMASSITLINSAFVGVSVSIKACLIGYLFLKMRRPLDTNREAAEAVKRTFTHVMLMGLHLYLKLAPLRLQKNDAAEKWLSFLPMLIPFLLGGSLIRAAALKPTLFPQRGSHIETILRAICVAAFFYSIPDFLQKEKDPLIYSEREYVIWSVRALTAVYLVAFYVKCARLIQEVWRREFLM